ncbi:MAG: peptidase T [Elusimicrobiaceae bacterium]|nr:peptidase T [Elusimicrobiaceae bacterium]
MKQPFLKWGVVLACCLCGAGYLAAQQTDWKAQTHYDKKSSKELLTKRFTKYVTFDTQTQESAQIPSTPGQAKFAKELAKELKKNGAVNVKVDKHSFVTAEIPSNLDKPAPTVAFLAHMDTAWEVSGRNVKPQIHANYKGGDILINAEKHLVLNSSNAPQLARAIGHDIITASGGTLLGADDKTGIAIIMTMVQYLYDHPSFSHGPIKIAFTPDEETGNGISQFDTTAFGADYAYTVDGGDLGQLTDETFQAKSFRVLFEGFRAVHPGQAMNAPFADNVLMASDFHTLLPRHKRPETTSGRRGFILVDSITTHEDRTEIKGILRCFSDEEMQELVQEVTNAFNTVKRMHYKGKNFELSFADQYKNMKSVLPQETIRLAEMAMKAENITPQRHAARGGTDGSQLSFKGLPTPDLFSGQYNIHSQLEYADVDVMEASFRTVLQLISLWALQPMPAR